MALLISGYYLQAPGQTPGPFLSPKSEVRAGQVATASSPKSIKQGETQPTELRLPFCTYTWLLFNGEKRLLDQDLGDLDLVLVARVRAGGR